MKELKKIQYLSIYINWFTWTFQLSFIGQKLKEDRQRYKLVLISIAFKNIMIMVQLDLHVQTSGANASVALLENKIKFIRGVYRHGERILPFHIGAAVHEFQQTSVSDIKTPLPQIYDRVAKKFVHLNYNYGFFRIYLFFLIMLAEMQICNSSRNANISTNKICRISETF